MADEQAFAQDIQLAARGLEPLDWAEEERKMLEELAAQQPDWYLNHPLRGVLTIDHIERIVREEAEKQQIADLAEPSSEAQCQGVVHDVQDWATDNGVTVSPQEAEYLVEKLKIADGADAAVREDKLNELLDHYQAADERGENPTWQGVADSLAQRSAEPVHTHQETSAHTDLVQAAVVPADIREHVGYAVEAFDAFMAGKSIPQVALNYQYEPGQAEIFLRNVVQEYGVEQLRGVVPGDILATLDRERCGFVDRESARRTTQSAVAEIAAELSDYAGHQTRLPYVNAEAAIATNFLQQLTNGNKTIDLSQRYATDDPALAQERHERALENLRPLIREASRLDGYTVQRGSAIANGLVEREVPAISQRQGQSVSA